MGRVNISATGTDIHIPLSPKSIGNTINNGRSKSKHLHKDITTDSFQCPIDCIYDAKRMFTPDTNKAGK